MEVSLGFQATKERLEKFKSENWTISSTGYRKYHSSKSNLEYDKNLGKSTYTSKDVLEWYWK